MKINLILGIMFCFSMLFCMDSHSQSYELTFSTFLGGGVGEVIRDIEADREGFIYAAGTTRSPDFPTTPGAFIEKLDVSAGETRWGYNSDIFVVKFSPDGELVWSTLIGGPNSEEAYGLEIDGKGDVVVHGRGAPGSLVTDDVYQKQFKGCGGGDPGNPHNTAQNAYICKLSPDGANLLWGSFFGIDHLHRDLALDKNDDIYVTWGVRPDENDPNHWNTWMAPEWNAHAFQPNPMGGANCGVAKIASDGTRVLWATYLGGSDYDSIEASIDVDEEGYVYVGLQTRSTDIPTTPGAHDRTHNGGVDWYIAKLKPDGSGLIYGTYIGDEGDNWLNTHNLAVDKQGNCYSTTCAFSAKFPTTAGAIQRTFGGNVDWGIVKLSPTGSLLAGTLLGGRASDNPDGIRFDSQGNLALFGQTASADFPVSNDAFQPKKNSQDDAVIVKLSPNLDQILYSTFLGGRGADAGRAGCVAPDDNMIVAGSSNGTDWPVRNAFQRTLHGSGDAITAKLSPITAIHDNSSF
ncbi:MAG: SBBP repeat-containing protein [Candidatus Omnitrophica bacterium]|nr:SBBP repeat-containing protein [Candidatus Omnitrophota bacterium]